MYNGSNFLTFESYILRNYIIGQTKRKKRRYLQRINYKFGYQIREQKIPRNFQFFSIFENFISKM